MYGDGLYFASEFCKAHQYTCPRGCAHSCDCAGERTLILAWVVLADPYYTKKTLEKTRKPPDRPHHDTGKSRGAFNSIVVNPGPMQGHHSGHQDHQEFVLFELTQAFPAYVIQYAVEA